MYEYIDPEISEAQFEIRSSQGNIAYGMDVDEAYLAYWTLHKDESTQGTKVTVINLETGKLVWSD